MQRRLSAMKYWVSAPERVVVGIYAFALGFPLLLLAIMWLLGADLPYLLPYPYYAYAFVWPLSVTYFPVLFVLFLLPISPSSSWSSSPDLRLVFTAIGFLLILFYPLVSYYLWRRNRVAWTLSFISSLATIGLEAYSATLTEGIINYWAFGIAANFLILYLLLRYRSKFFNPW